MTLFREAHKRKKVSESPSPDDFSFKKYEGDPDCPKQLKEYWEAYKEHERKVYSCPKKRKALFDAQQEFEENITEEDLIFAVLKPDVNRRGKVLNKETDIKKIFHRISEDDKRIRIEARRIMKRLNKVSPIKRDIALTRLEKKKWFLDKKYMKKKNN